MIKRILLILTVCSLIACKNDESKSTNSSSEQVAELTDSYAKETDEQGGIWAPAGEGELIRHYLCPDRCKGGFADNAGQCRVCGKALLHNQAFHFNNKNEEILQSIKGERPKDTSFDPPQSPNGIWHFLCINNHGSAVAGICTICGEEYKHNQEYHMDSENEEPAQNEKGIWHFICPNGHEKGAGAPLACDVCGAKLEHNLEYHEDLLNDLKN